MDLFTRILKTLFIPLTIRDITNYKPVELMNLSTTCNPTSFTLCGHTFYHSQNILLQTLIKIVSFLPFADSNYRENYKTLIESFKINYSNILAHADLVFNEISVASDVADSSENPNSDTYLKYFVSQGPGSILIKKNTTDDFYSIDLNEMTKFEVRSGFIPYGGKLVFDSDFKFQSIQYNGKIFFPCDAHWNHLKYIFRSSLITNNIIKYHAGYLHLFCGSRVPFALSKMQSDHYLNILMIPFTFKNIPAVELAKNILYGNRKYFHRVFAFNQIGIDSFNTNSFDTYTYTTFIDHYQSVKDLAVNSPYFVDGLELWKIIYKYVNSYIKLHYKQDDLDLKQFVETLVKISENKFLIECTIDSISTFLTQYIFQCTHIHEVIGNSILKYSYDPRIMSTKLRWSENLTDMYTDVQTYHQSMVIAIATSVAKLPKLLDDYSFLAKDNETKDLHKIFNKDLVELAEKIEAKNLTREPYNGANPTYLEVSMSV